MAEFASVFSKLDLSQSNTSRIFPSSATRGGRFEHTKLSQDVVLALLGEQESARGKLSETLRWLQQRYNVPRAMIVQIAAPHAEITQILTFKSGDGSKLLGMFIAQGKSVLCNNVENPVLIAFDRAITGAELGAVLATLHEAPDVQILRMPRRPNLP